MAHAGREFGQGPARLLHHDQDLQRADEPVAGRRLVEAQQVAGRLAPQLPAGLLQHRQHVAVTDVGPPELDAGLRQRPLQPEVRHLRADHRADQRAGVLARSREHVQQLIAVDQVAVVVDHQHAVPVAIEGDAEVRADRLDGDRHQLGAGGAAAVVDVLAVRRAADRDDLGPELAHDARRHLVAGAMRAVEHDLERIEPEPGRHGRQAEALVVLARAVDALGLAQRTRVPGDGRFRQKALDPFLDFVRQLRAAFVEELDAVVVIRVV